MADQTLARHVNERALLTLLRTRGPASRAELARQLALTPATVTRLVSELQRRELVLETKKAAPGDLRPREPGRPSVAIRLNPSGAFFFGAEIGVGVLRTCLIDLALTVVSSKEVTVPRRAHPRDVIDRIAGELKLLRSDRRWRERIQAAGVTVPGLIRRDGHIVHLPILGWKDVDLGGQLAQRISLPCTVENNANAAAFGCVYSEPKIATDCAIFLKLGTGCGGAAIINGRLLRGAAGTAGEFGHVKLTESGGSCSCGQVGCLETWVNLAALARLWKFEPGLADRRLRALPADVVAAAQAGDRAATAAAAAIATRLGEGIVSLVNIFNPSTVVLGGVMAPVIAFTLDDIRARVGDGIVPGTLMPDIRLSGLGNLDCATGAACLAHHDAFDLSPLSGVT